MTFANPLGLLGLLSLPVILGIHLYHRRFPPLEIAGLHLWAVESEVRLAGRRRDRLPITLTLILELLAALFLTLIISQPRFGEVDSVTHLVAVLDDSASMSGGPPGEATFREQAIEELRQRMDEYGSDSVVTLIQSGARPVMLAGPAVPWSEAETRLSAWQPQATRHNFAPAWDLAQQVADQTGQLLFLTDHIPTTETNPAAMEIVSVGRKLENVAVTTAVWEFDAATGVGTIHLRLTNLGEKAADAQVTGRSGSTPIFEKAITISAGGKSALNLTVPGGVGKLDIDVTSPRDGLVLDNRVQLIEPQVRTVGVAVELPEGPARDLFRRSLLALPNVAVVSADAADLIVTTSDRLPAAESNAWWLGIGPLNPSEAARKAAKNLIGPYVIEKENPLLDGVTLAGVIWAGVQPVTQEATPLISVGKTPLLAQLVGTRAAAYLLNIDLEQSSLSESPDWPILISNLIELRRSDLPGLNRWNYRLGEGVRFRLYNGLVDPADESDPKPLMLVHDGGQRTLPRGSVIDILPPNTAGVYEIREGDSTVGRFAVNFEDAEESNLQLLFPGGRQSAQPNPTALYQIDPKYSWILVAATFLTLVLLLLNWWVVKSPRTAA
ncbi:hypothetical protein CA54_38920 [Symmachiella macrocystis]|uniref:Aerotolerance regulator N-terminal domain-containing protein n=1 Tax=Symmachiella macrocystis TaxID=2527985 RepID=A0A5C6BBM0_9PLAN|nr:BatA domain-containing protein [Symmachiella macrocystis]TWU08656.1 hypothetical protein CA54_38920 [Symmachiella macrocystis]